MQHIGKGVVTLVGLVLLWSSSGGALTIDTTTAWDGAKIALKELEGGLGEPGLATVGQTFTVGAESILEWFTFWLLYRGPVQATRFTAFVMEWDHAARRATGPILYHSEDRQTAQHNDMQAFTFEVGALALVPGTKYVAFLNTSAFWDGRENRAQIGSPQADVYGGGELVSQYTGNDFSVITSGGWGLGFLESVHTPVVTQPSSPAPALARRPESL